MSLELCLALAECEYWTWQSLLWSCAERQQQKQNKKRNMKLFLLQPSDCHEVVVVFKHNVFSELLGASCHAGRTSMTLA